MLVWVDVFDSGEYWASDCGEFAVSIEDDGTWTIRVNSTDPTNEDWYTTIHTNSHDVVIAKKFCEQLDKEFNDKWDADHPFGEYDEMEYGKARRLFFDNKHKES